MRYAMALFTKIVFFLVLLTAAIFAATGQMDILVEKCGGTIVSDSNNRYLKDAFERSVKTFLVLSAIKSGVAILEGSEVGIGFHLEIGDIAQSMYDYVDIAWKTALAGGTVLLLMRLILETMELINHWCLFFMFLLIVLLFFLNWVLPKKKRLNRILKECLLLASVLTAAFYIILPLSIAGAAFLSKQITRPLVEEAQKGFESLQEDLTFHTLNKRFFPEKQEDNSLWSQLDLKSKLETSKAAITEIVAYFKEITEDFAVWTIKIIAGYLFDCIIFPLAFFVVVYILTKKLLAYAFGIRRDYTIKEDFEAILAKHYVN